MTAVSLTFNGQTLHFPSTDDTRTTPGWNIGLNLSDLFSERDSPTFSSLFVTFGESKNRNKKINFLKSILFSQQNFVDLLTPNSVWLSFPSFNLSRRRFSARCQSVLVLASIGGRRVGPSPPLNHRSNWHPHRSPPPKKNTKIDRRRERGEPIIWRRRRR